VGAERAVVHHIRARVRLCDSSLFAPRNVVCYAAPEVRRSSFGGSGIVFRRERRPKHTLNFRERRRYEHDGTLAGGKRVF